MRNTLNVTTNVLIVYHKVDWDGLMSAAIVLWSIGKADLLPMNYGDEVPPIKTLRQYETVYIVDFSLPKDIMEDIWDKVVWIDHHVSAIKALGDTAYEGIQDTSFSACELCWMWFHPTEPMPRAVQLLGEYDIFEKTGRYADWDDILAFQLASRAIPLDLPNAGHFLEMSEAEIIKLLSTGRAIVSFKREEEKTAFSRLAWDVTIKGRPAKALFANDMSSLICEQTLANGDADIVILLNRCNDTVFKASIRVSERSDFDASAFAREYSGGGHQKAAGCLFTVDEVLHLYTNHTI